MPLKNKTDLISSSNYKFNIGFSNLCESIGFNQDGVISSETNEPIHQ